MHRPYRYMLLAALCLTPSLVFAGKVKVWHQHQPSHYEKAQLKQAVISNEGSLRLSRQLKPLAAVEATHVWDIIEDKAGNLIVATGDEGKIYKVTPEGKATVLHTADDSQVFCLAAASDGTIYAGTGPNGKILRIGTDSKTSVCFDTKESYVWCLTVDEKGDNVYAGTGPKGRIYQVSSQGKGSLFYATKQEHILCMAMGPKNTLYAGTDKAGLVYRIDDKGKGFVLYNAPQNEVRSLLVTADGVYCGTSAPTRRKGGGGSSPSVSDRSASNLTADVSIVPVSAKKDKEDSKDKENTETKPGEAKSSTSSTTDTPKSTPASAPRPPASGENSLFRINTDGSVREIFREKTLMLCLTKQDGKLFVGTGMDGQLFEIDEKSRERSEIARLDHGQIHCMCRCKNGSIVLGTGDPGKLYVLQDKFVAKGSVVSEVLDAKIISKWGALRWKSEVPQGTGLSVAVRSGNVQEPDETWSDWSDEKSDAANATVDAPTARFLQYRVTMSTENTKVSPTLNSLAVRYQTTNQAPEITAVEVPDLDTVNVDNPKKLKLKWNSTDQNEDELTYSLFIRKEGWKNWVALEENLDKKDFEWDTTTTPSGTYQLKVVASDVKDNVKEEVLAGEKVSAPFVVSHTPPTVNVKITGMEGDQAVVEATAADPMVRLTSASFSVNGKKWSNLFPADGLFDSKSETFKFKTDTLKPGTYVMVIKVTDAAGNTGSGDAVFTVQVKK